MHTPSSEQERVFERWEVLPNEPDHVDWWSAHTSAEMVKQTLATWQDDHPEWNPDADLDHDARLLWDWFADPGRSK